MNENPPLAESPNVSKPPRRYFPLRRIILWSMMVLSAAACLWLWWTLGRIHEAQQQRLHEAGKQQAAER